MQGNTSFQPNMYYIIYSDGWKAKFDSSAKKKNNKKETKWPKYFTMNLRKLHFGILGIDVNDKLRLFVRSEALIARITLKTDRLWNGFTKRKSWFGSGGWPLFSISLCHSPFITLKYMKWQFVHPRRIVFFCNIGCRLTCCKHLKSTWFNPFQSRLF